MVRNVLMFALARGLPAAFSFVLTAMLTHFLAPADYGRFTLVLSAGAFVSSFGYQWLVLACVRFGSSMDDADDTGRATVLACFLAMTAVLLGILLILMLVPRTFDFRWFLLPGTLIVIGQAWLDLNLGFAVARVEPVRYGWLGMIRSVAALILSLPVAALTRSAPATLAALALSYVIAGTWTTKTAWSGVRIRRVSLPRAKSLAHFGTPLALQYALEVIIAFADRFLLAALVGVSAAGAYAVGYDVAQQSLGMLMIVVNLAGYPLAVRSHDAGDALETQRQLAHHAALLIALALPAAAGLATLASAVASTVFDSAYVAQTRTVIPIIAFASLLAGLKAFYFDLAFQLSKQTRYQVRIAFCAIAVNILANLLVVGRYGVVGAAWATLGTYACSMLASAVLGRRFIRMPIPWEDVMRVVAATCVMIAVLWPVRGVSGALPLTGVILLGVIAFGLPALALDVANLRRPVLRFVRLVHP